MLTPFNMADLEAPIDGPNPVVELQRQGQWYTAELSGQSATGPVRLKFVDGNEEVPHLEKEEFRWV